MNAWFDDHETLRSILNWAIYTDAFRLGSAMMYVIFAVGIWNLGAKFQSAIVHKNRPPGQFPAGYFIMLAVQLIPLTITGFVLHDVYIISTRLGTLGTVLVVYGMISSADGTYDMPYYRRHVLIWLALAIMGPMIWMSSVPLQVFVHDWEKVIAHASVAVMMLFVIWGQGVAAKALFYHFLQGNYTIKRLELQVVRFFGFFLQAAHYGLAPLVDDKPFAWLDPIFLQGAIGALGVAMVLFMSLAGFVKGTRARRKMRREARNLTSS
jgi:hypothetical protein